MAENLTISKAPPPFTSMDFDALRKAGIEHFERMGTNRWTDFNLHDPGITILEVLCYAITDLGYRTNFPIQDILASADNYADKKQFFSALEILTCNPVTENDFRKILIDLGGIKNAWLVKTEKQEMWIDKDTDGKLNAAQPENTVQSQILLNGLYDVYIDLDDAVDHHDMETVDDIIKCAWGQLWKHRNLCEDYVRVNVVEELEFGIDAQVELCPDADVSKVEGDIYYTIQEFLTPTIQFYNFNEMYEGKKRSCEEIFEGPVLCNGFIDDDELDKAQLRKEIYKSDLWQVIMDVCGVAAIKKLSIYKCNESDQPEGATNAWCLQIDKYHKPKLNIKCSKVLFQKGYDCVYPDERKVLEQIALQQKLHQPRRKSQERMFAETGINRNPDEYFTVQDEFPSTYKIAEGQITNEDLELRKAQVKQLKGYLLLFDEMLANYLALLSRVKDLLSVSQPEENTYFYQTLYNISGVQDLIKDFTVNGNDDWEKFKNNNDNGYVTGLKALIETEIRRKERKNIFIDHLLARFGESFTDYVVKSFQEQCSCTAKQEGITIEDKLLKDKAAFLLNIPELSSERGKGFNYKAVDCGKPDVWDSSNVEGLKKRVCKYLGYEDYKRKTLTCPPEFEIVLYRDETEGVVQTYRLQLKNKENKVLLNGLKSYRQQSNALKAAKELREQLLKGKIFLSAAENAGYASVIVKDREDNIALESEVMEIIEAKALMEAIEALAFPEDCAVEGFHIVEHILLRPKDDGYNLFDPIFIKQTNIKYAQLLITETLPARKRYLRQAV